MSTPKLGRNARLYKDGVVIGYGKNISVKASAELIKEYSVDSLTLAIVAPGKQTFNARYFSLKQKSAFRKSPLFLP